MKHPPSYGMVREPRVIDVKTDHFRFSVLNEMRCLITKLFDSQYH